MILPSPLAISALGTTLIVGGALGAFFLKQVRLGVIAGLVGAFLLACAGVAYGYEAMGEAKIRPQLDAANARIANDEARAESFRQDAVVAQTVTDAALKAKNARITALDKQLRAKVNALPPAVANAVVPADVGGVLQPAIDAVNASAAAGAGVVAEGATAAAVSIRSTTTAAWVDWSVTVIEAYGQCSNQVAGLQDYVAKLVAASEKANR